MLMRDPMEIFEGWLKKKPRLWAFYRRWNPCHGELPDGTTKPDSWFVDKFLHRLFYWDCACCASFRGVLAGLFLGWLLWRW